MFDRLDWNDILTNLDRIFQINKLLQDFQSDMKFKDLIQKLSLVVSCKMAKEIGMCAG